MDKLKFWLECLRVYALPMSIMAWAIPFVFGYVHNGKVAYGLLALVGIICIHLGANLFDDLIDYKRYLVFQNDSNAINLKKGKCRLFFEKKITLWHALIICLLLFAVATAIGIYFISIYKLPIIIIMAITAILCLVYPVSGYVAMGEIIIGTIFSPLLFAGVYMVMTGTVSRELMLLSVSFALVTISLLYTDFYLDFNYDKSGGKKTIPILLGCKYNAYYFYIFMLFVVYANLFIGIHAHVFSMKYLLIFLSVIPALNTVKVLQNYINKEIKNDKEFFYAMNNVQKYIAIFTILSIVSFF